MNSIDVSSGTAHFDDRQGLPDQQLGGPHSPGRHHWRGARAGMVPYVAAALSAGYALAGLYWTSGGHGFPFGTENDPLAHHQSVLEHVTRANAAPWVAAAGLFGVCVALAMVRLRSMGVVGRLLLGAAWLQAVVYSLVIPDGRPLVAAAHIPILLAGKPFGWPPGVTISSQVSWPVANQLILMFLGATWAASAVIFRRRAVGACSVCGRTQVPASWTTPQSAARWGRWGVGAAIAVPAVYAATRLAWAAGIPLGVSRRFLTEQAADTPEIFVAGAFMAALALGGATLTLGLVRRWGEVYPRWVPWLRNKPVRPRTAIIPATAVAFLITGPGVGWVRSAVLGYFPEGAMGEDWGTVAPGALWPLWGIGLGAATYAYYLRRRGQCAVCGRR
ncbi:NYN domain-containing protein [Actinopolymorpha sp. B11F2]|uniref:NYN domain-containing protein n=1 Tax=Actinopolymorpha sp. B11F2 TaxID=3160862 RepID=UPI0032E3BA18